MLRSHDSETKRTPAAVLHHPNIVPVYEFGEIEGVHFFSMEFVDGHSLADRIVHGPIEPDAAAGYLKEISRTIAYAHSRGFLHRDLKPSNILVDSAGRPRVTDFGLVKPINAQSELTGEGAFVGTPSYIAPNSLSRTATRHRRLTFTHSVRFSTPC